jgi:multiple sugar transport system permease protein/trehalose/maltose transport system permease protein
MGMIIPFFIVFRRLNLINTPWALILSYNLFILPLSIWLLKSYFDRVPPDLEEMSMIDGLGRLGALFRIVIPVAVPGFIAVFIMAMMEGWSEFFFALVLTDELTLPPVLIGFEQMHQINWTTMAAATVMAIIPPLTLVLILQKYIITGLTAGAVKG